MRVGIAFGSAVGLLLGVGGFTFIYARGYSYHPSDPDACINCHVMKSSGAPAGGAAR